MTCTFIRKAARLLLASYALTATLTLCAPHATSAQDRPADTAQQQTATQQPAQGEATATTQAARPQDAAPADEPLYKEFKGVKLGTSREEARKKLGNPQEKDKEQDFFVFSDRERARVYYDEKGAASAVIVTYIGKSGDIPTPKAILGADIEPKQDGSMYRIVYYPKAGYWVAYSRTAGDEPLTMITMQRIASANH